MAFLARYRVTQARASYDLSLRQWFGGLFGWKLVVWGLVVRVEVAGRRTVGGVAGSPQDLPELCR